MKTESINQEKKKYDFVNIPLEEEEKQAIRIKAAGQKKSMAAYIRDLVRADMAKPMQHAGAGQ